MSNTAIFVDYDNVFITLQKYYEKSDCVNIQEEIIKKLRDYYSSDNIILYKAYLNFETLKFSPIAYQLFKTNQLEMFQVYKGNNASDITLIIDIMKSLYNDKHTIDKYVIVSSDSDMIPVISEIRKHGKKVEVFYFEFNTSEDYRKYYPTSECRFNKIEDIFDLELFVSENAGIFDNVLKTKLIIEKLNTCIQDKYNEHKRIYNGQIIAAGTCNKTAIREFIELEKFFVLEHIKKGFAISALFSKDILYEYNLPDSNYRAVLINKNFITDNSIDIDTSTFISESDFSYPITI